MNISTLKVRLWIELLTLFTPAILFLVAFPQRPTFVDFGLGLFALLLLGLNAGFTKAIVWREFPPIGHKHERFRSCLMIVLATTLPLVAGRFGAKLLADSASGGWMEALTHSANWHILIAFTF